MPLPAGGPVSPPRPRSRSRRPGSSVQSYRRPGGFVLAVVLCTRAMLRRPSAWSVLPRGGGCFSPAIAEWSNDLSAGWDNRADRGGRRKVVRPLGGGPVSHPRPRSRSRRPRTQRPPVYHGWPSLSPAGWHSPGRPASSPPQRQARGRVASAVARLVGVVSGQELRQRLTQKGLPCPDLRHRS
jgi:hypothetical protein